MYLLYTHLTSLPQNHKKWREDHSIDGSNKYVERRFSVQTPSHMTESAERTSQRGTYIFGVQLLLGIEMCSAECAMRIGYSCMTWAALFGLEQTLFIRLIFDYKGAHGECMSVHGRVQAEATRAERNARWAAVIRNGVFVIIWEWGNIDIQLLCLCIYLSITS